MKKENPKDHIKLLYHMARKYNAGPNVSIDEIASWGYDGLHYACQNFDRSKCTFGQYAPFPIKDHIKVNHMRSIRVMAKEPKNGVTGHTSKAYSLAENYKICSLNKPAANSGDGSGVLERIDFVRSKTNTEYSYSLKELIIKIFWYVETLGTKNYKPFKLRYVTDLTYVDIAKKTGVTKQAVENRLARVREKIKDKFQVDYNLG